MKMSHVCSNCGTAVSTDTLKSVLIGLILHDTDVRNALRAYKEGYHPHVQVVGVTEEQRQENLQMTIVSLCLPLRVAAVIRRLGDVVTVADLLEHTENELLSYRNFGPVSLKQLRIRLGELGLTMRPY